MSTQKPCSGHVVPVLHVSLPARAAGCRVLRCCSIGSTCGSLLGHPERPQALAQTALIFALEALVMRCASRAELRHALCSARSRHACHVRYRWRHQRRRRRWGILRKQRTCLVRARYVCKGAGGTTLHLPGLPCPFPWPAHERLSLAGSQLNACVVARRALTPPTGHSVAHGSYRPCPSRRLNIQ